MAAAGNGCDRASWHLAHVFEIGNGAWKREVFQHFLARFREGDLVPGNVEGTITADIGFGSGLECETKVARTLVRAHVYVRVEDEGHERLPGRDFRRRPKE